MSMIVIPEILIDSRHCPHDSIAGTRCPQDLDDNGCPPCHTCEDAIHDAHHIAHIALRLREIPGHIDELVKEENPWPINRTRSEMRGTMETLLAEFYELTELMRRLEETPDILGVVPSSVGYTDK